MGEKSENVSSGQCKKFQNVACGLSEQTATELESVASELSKMKAKDEVWPASSLDGESHRDSPDQTVDCSRGKTVDYVPPPCRSSDTSPSSHSHSGLGEKQNDITSLVGCEEGGDSEDNNDTGDEFSKVSDKQPPAHQSPVGTSVTTTFSKKKRGSRTSTRNPKRKYAEMSTYPRHRSPFPVKDGMIEMAERTEKERTRLTFHSEFLTFLEVRNQNS